MRIRSKSRYLRFPAPFSCRAWYSGSEPTPSETVKAIALIQTSRQIRQEASPLLYKLYTFDISHIFSSYSIGRHSFLDTAACRSIEAVRMDKKLASEVFGDVDLLLQPSIVSILRMSSLQALPSLVRLRVN
jgi:hypothetical protein